MNLLSKSQLPSSYGLSEGDLKIWKKRVTQLINDEGVCRKGLATPGLLMIHNEASDPTFGRIFH